MGIDHGVKITDTPTTDYCHNPKTHLQQAYELGYFFIFEKYLFQNNRRLNLVIDDKNKLLDHKEFLLEAIRQIPQVMQYIGLEYRLKPEFIYQAIQLNHEVINYIHQDITVSRGTLLKSLKQGPIAKDVIPSNMLSIRAANNLYPQSKHAAKNFIRLFLKAEQDIFLRALIKQILYYENHHPAKAKKIIITLADLCDKNNKLMIKNAIINAIKDTNSPLYQALNTHRNPLPITFFGPSAIISTKTRGLQKIELALKTAHPINL